MAELKVALVNAALAMVTVLVPVLVAFLVTWLKAKTEELKTSKNLSENEKIRGREIEALDIIERAAEAVLHVSPKDLSIENYLKAVSESAKKEISDSTHELFKSIGKDIEEIIKNQALVYRNKFFRGTGEGTN